MVKGATNRSQPFIKLQEVNTMFKYDYSYESENTSAIHRDPCDVFEEQRAYVFALGLSKACVQIGK